ncbi:MAG TPA: SigB/SigF/SigG family RNA polymerase sigma factor [Acidimicrobiia bacterium]|jgi:RNA polymerase sigma-B factor|nr:SigB/SigF/SigG family RNA polymerase sigma factor [Acidimicrobiia bacterium]
MSSERPSREELRTKFEEFSRTRDRRTRNQLIEAHRALATHLARRYANRGEPLDDLVQVAFVGMLKAVERFDPDRGLEFSTFATATIEGELKRHFRDKTWSVRVPRRSQELHLRLGPTIAELTQRLGRAPRIPEIAEELGIRVDDVLEAMEVGGAYRSASLDAASGEGRESVGLAERLGTLDANFDLVEHRALIERALATLPEREQVILRLRFFEDLTQTEIADQVGVSQMHVSRLLARSLANLRQQLQTAER